LNDIFNKFFFFPSEIFFSLSYHLHICTVKNGHQQNQKVFHFKSPDLPAPENQRKTNDIYPNPLLC